MMALTLYHGEPNGPSLTVLAALFETGVEAELRYIDLARCQRHQPDALGRRPGQRHDPHVQPAEPDLLHDLAGARVPQPDLHARVRPPEGRQNRRQVAWLTEQIKHRAGHTLVVPS